MIGRLVGGVALVAALVAFAVYALVRMPLLDPVGDEAAARALAFSRAVVEGSAPPMILAESAPQRGLPVLLTLFDRGAVVARGRGQGDTFGLALRAAATQLASAHVAPEILQRGRLKLDRVIGRGYLSKTIAPLLALGVVPARDGIGGEQGGADAYLTVDDLLTAGLWGGYVPAPALEFSIGLDARRATRALGDALAVPGRRAPERVFRFRAEEYLESAAHDRVLPIVGGDPPGPALSRETLADGARAGGAYLLRHLDDAGRFDYEYYTVADLRSTADDYSLPRHAGAASFLSQLYALDHDVAVRRAAERALDFLQRTHPAGCGASLRCVGNPQQAGVEIGSSALGLVAASEYERTTGDMRYRAFAIGLAEFILFMQKASGDFCHLYDSATRVRDEKTQLLYFSGEAAYGLARMLGNLTSTDGNLPLPPTLVERADRALDRALGYLTEGAYAHFAGQFYVGEDHWTCMALDAGWAVLPPAHREKYARFCEAYGEFLRRTQMRAGDSLVDAQPQLVGAYGLSAAIAPHTTPVGSRSETTISIWHIAKERGLASDDPRVTRPREQVLDGLRFLLAHQVRDDNAYLMPDPAAARGGLLMSDVERHIRIDFLQHSCSAMLRALSML